MKKQFSGIILFFALVGYAHAQAEVYLCVDENGNKEYKNTGATKGCKKVELPGITTIPAPVRKPGPMQSAEAKSPSDFPKVDRDTQKNRDTDRRKILQDEMASEEKKLADLKKEYKNGEPDRNGNERNFAKYQERVETMKEGVNRSEKNIEALKRELANVK